MVSTFIQSVSKLNVQVLRRGRMHLNKVISPYNTWPSSSDKAVDGVFLLWQSTRLPNKMYEKMQKFALLNILSNRKI